MELLAFALCVIAAYFLGSIPTGVLLGRWLKGVDVRQYGSGKTGATNSLRTLGWKISLAVFLIDAAKGGAAVALPLLFFTDASNNWLPWVRMVCAVVCMMGHNYSVWINFGGGRGVAVGVGELLVISPLAWILAAIITVPTIIITRYVSLGSIVGSIGAVLTIGVAIMLGTLDPRYLGFVIVCASLIIWMHRDNIKRLLNGTERKLGEKAKPVSGPGPQPKEKAGHL